MYFNWLYGFVKIINSCRWIKYDFGFVYVECLLVYGMVFFVVYVYSNFFEFGFENRVFSIVFYVIGIFVKVFYLWNVVLV